MAEFFVISVIVTTIIIVVYTYAYLFIHLHTYIVHIGTYIFWKQVIVMLHVWIFYHCYYCFSYLANCLLYIYIYIYYYYYFLLFLFYIFIIIIYYLFIHTHIYIYTCIHVYFYFLKKGDRLGAMREPLKETSSQTLG